MLGKETPIGMSCTHEELSKFARPEGRFEDLWDQLNILVDKATKWAESEREHDLQLQQRLNALKPKPDPDVLDTSWAL